MRRDEFDVRSHFKKLIHIAVELLDNGNNVFEACTWHHKHKQREDRQPHGEVTWIRILELGVGSSFAKDMLFLRLLVAIVFLIGGANAVPDFNTLTHLCVLVVFGEDARIKIGGGGMIRIGGEGKIVIGGDSWLSSANSIERL